ncbi:MAG: InlB B-repeat-containing protein, partial [Muribaculum sp.]|nr:InlB B-repeat-containing protein [Muribaculum sp.]
MKKTIVKYRHAIIALIMIVLNSVGASASTPWTVNPSDYRYDMSLYLDVAFDASDMDYSLYDVGVFCGDECRGVAEVLSLSDGKNCLYVRVRSNQEKGETMTLKYHDKGTEKFSDIDGVSFIFESNGRLGYPSDPYKFGDSSYFDVILNAGKGGSVNPASGRMAKGSVLTITATPDEGYSFVSWSDGKTENPRTVTVNGDIELSAEFSLNSYKLIYMLDGVEYKVYDIDYGAEIIPEEEPRKEGCIFLGWEGLPTSMPAHDVVVTGTFSAISNLYKAVFKIGDEIFATENIEYGMPITLPEVPSKEGYTFAGWQDVPETMPAHDIEILGSYI